MEVVSLLLLLGANTVNDLKTVISNQFGIPVPRQRLVHRAQELLNPSLSLFEAKVDDGDLIVLGRKPDQPSNGVFLCLQEIQAFCDIDCNQVLTFFTSC